MRTHGAVEDLVVVDLDDPDEVASRGPDAPRRHFEEHYAELPFGLGTVPRRLEHDPWFTRPGVVLWIAIALIGLLALAGSGAGTPPPPTPPEPRAISPLGVLTGAHLALYHVGEWTELDVDHKTLRRIPTRSLPADLAALPDGTSDLGVLPPRPGPAPTTYDGRTVCFSTTSGRLTARLAAPGTCSESEQAPVDLGSRAASSPDGRFFFVSIGSEILVSDTLAGGLIRRVDVELPPFEAIFIL